MAIEWAKLRTLDGTQQKAFEELCCQLAAQAQVLEGSKFTRKGTPDAGVEAYWTLPKGAEHGWQAKLFLSSPDNGQWQQIDKSVRNALEKHPALIKYTICLPIDRSDARIEGQKSFLERWNEHVETWKSWRKSGPAVEFEYWGAHEIWERLSRAENRVRYRFWFDHDLLTPDWLKGRLAEAIQNVGPRYTPALNIDLPIARLFDGLSRTRSFYGRIEEAITEVRRKARFLKRTGSPLELLKEVGDRYGHFLSVARLCGTARTEPLDWRGVGATAMECSDAAAAALQTLRAAGEGSEEPESGSRKSPTANSREVAERNRALEHDLVSFIRAVRGFAEIVDSEELALANLPALLIVGEAGTGKTHLLCDIAERWRATGVPAILLLGQQFADEEPWAQALKLLRFTGDTDEFLGALNAAGESSGAKSLLLIDAINEGAGRVLWPKFLGGFLAAVRRYPWVAICLTIRTSYERVVVPDGLIPNELIRAEHYGFANKEYDAVAQFFRHYGIELPSVPPLIPEFQNPLFLKLFCEGLKNEGLTSVPKGLQGITAIFRFYLESVDKKLTRDLDLDPKERGVLKAVDLLAAELANRTSSWLPRDEAKKIVDQLLPTVSFDRSLFARLVSEGVLSEDMHFDQGSGKYVDVVRFGYERFSDHLVCSRLLESHLNLADPAGSPTQQGPLQAVVADERASALNRGLIEALSVQLPERTGRELIEIVPSCASFWPVREAFVQSLVWRARGKFFKSTLEYINNEVLRHSDTRDEFLDALLTLAATPGHPYNARMLDRNLRSRALPERDAWWSIWLSQQEGRGGSVDRMVDWAWQGGDKSHISDESVHLAAVAITWFLTSNSRRLRDRSTKALVSLLQTRLRVLILLLDQFHETDDTYLTERLFAVAYGCAMRSGDRDCIGKLAQRVYDLVFASGSPPPNFLLRDHARGTIEIALAVGADIKVDESKVRPPYRSEWPTDIPTQQDLERYHDWHEGMPDAEWARVTLYSSVLGDGDFARYIIGTNSGWTQWSFLRRGDDRIPSKRQLGKEFVSSLKDDQRELWHRYEKAKRKRAKARRMELARERGSETTAGINGMVEAEKAAKEAKQQLIWSLNEPQRDLLRRIDGSAQGKIDLRFDLTLAQRFIFRRVLEFGWSVPRFGAYDRELRSHDRGEQALERIGKKYQWTALYECFARIADNFKWLGDGEAESYEGPWRPFHRNIDPSFLLTSSKRQSYPPYTKSWWFGVGYDLDLDEADNRAWLRKQTDLPPVEPLLRVLDPTEKTEWLALDGLYWWHQEKEEDEEYFASAPRRSLYYMVRSYCVKEEHAETFFEWATKQNFFGRWMPEPREVYHAYLGEFFWAPSVSRDYDPEGWETDPRAPCPLRVTSAGYLWEKGCDNSVDDVIRIALPSRWIWQEMNLRWRGVEGHFFDESGALACLDPSIREEGPSALLFRREPLRQFLGSQGLALIWTVLGEKQVLSSERDYPGWAAVSGAFRLGGDRFEGHLNYFPDIRERAG